MLHTRRSTVSDLPRRLCTKIINSRIRPLNQDKYLISLTRKMWRKKKPKFSLSLPKCQATRFNCGAHQSNIKLLSFVELNWEISLFFDQLNWNLETNLLKNLKFAILSQLETIKSLVIQKWSKNWANQNIYAKMFLSPRWQHKKTSK